MESELDVIDSLNALAYKGNCLNSNTFSEALKAGLKNSDFRELICWLTQELSVLRKTDERVSADVEDEAELAMELSAMLKELGCPYQQFVTGSLSERFQTYTGRIQLLEYLISELMAIKMSLRLRPAEPQNYIIPKFETNTARALEQLAMDLCLGKPPDNVTPKQIFSKLNFKIEEQMRNVKPGILSEPLLRTHKPLTDEQWKTLEAIHEDLDSEYNLRRQVLLTRLEVTIQSFQWSDNVKSKVNDIVGRFQTKMKDLEALKYGGDDTNIMALLAARADLAIIEKTSCANVRKNTGSKIQKHVIGSVPDRGGRANEHAPPPPEMPSWQQQRASGGGGGHRGGAGHGGGGGWRGGGHNQPQQQRQQQNFEQRQQQNFEQHQQHHHDQRSQFDQGRNQNWMGGSGRVQGVGWSQHNDDQYRGGNTNNSRIGDAGANNYNNDRKGGYNNSEGDRNNRGRSNYNRGGRGGYRR